MPTFDAGSRRLVLRRVDSVAEVVAGGVGRRYDLVAVDNPLGVYGPDGRHCEHFDVIHGLHRLLRDRAVVLLDVAPGPYDADRHPAWMARRADFYGATDPRDLEVDFLVAHCTELFDRDGWSTRDAFAVCREYESGVDYFWYLAFDLERRGRPPGRG